MTEILAASGPRGGAAIGPLRRFRIGPALFITPTLIVSLGLIALPLLYSIRISLYDYTLQTGVSHFVGLGNYSDALRDPRFYKTWWVTLRIALPALAAEFIFGLLIAMMLYSIRGLWRPFIASVLAVPVLIPGTAAAVAFAMMYVERYGVANALLSMLLRRPIDVPWLSSAPLAPWAVTLVDVWQRTPFVMLFLLAGLSMIPDDIYDAANVDGARGWSAFRYIIFPLLLPTITAVVVLRLIDLLKMFDIPFILTGGGPGEATEPVSMYIMEIGFRQLRVGLGAAQSWLLVAVVSCLVLIFLRSARTPGVKA